MMTDIMLRLATLADAELAFDWRNAKQTRQYSFNSKSLDKKEHIQWFKHSLARTDRYLLIAEKLGNPIGVLRYDIIDDYAEVGIYLNPLEINKGYGTELLQLGHIWVQKNCPTVKRIVAKIIAENIPSCRAFEKADFKLQYLVYEKSLREGE